MAPCNSYANDQLLLIMCILQAAKRAGRPWAGDAVAALVRGGLSAFRLAHAEAGARAALPPTARRAVQPGDPEQHMTRSQATSILADVPQALTPLVSHKLAKQGLAGPLLEVGLPCQLLMQKCVSSRPLLLKALTYIAVMLNHAHTNARGSRCLRLEAWQKCSDSQGEWYRGSWL